MIIIDTSCGNLEKLIHLQRKSNMNQQMRITKSIHLIFLRRDEAVPSLFRECKHRIREMHPSWNITLWNEESGLQYLKNELSEYVQAYTSFTYNVQRADFLRLALVYGMGGFYMDLDMYPLQALDNLLEKSLVLAEEMTVSEKTQKSLNLKYRNRIANYMFGGEAGHPFLRKMMDAMAERSTIKVSSQQEILDVTGPGLLTDTYWDNTATYPDITLLRNEGWYVELPDGRKETCLFGKYAVHLHAGTWRKEI